MAFWNKFHNAASSATPVVISNNPGVTLGGVVVGTKSGAGGLLSIYDSATTAGTSAANLVSAIDLTVPTATVDFACLMNTGITFVQTGSATPGDITILYR